MIPQGLLTDAGRETEVNDNVLRSTGQARSEEAGPFGLERPVRSNPPIQDNVSFSVLKDQLFPMRDELSPDRPLNLKEILALQEAERERLDGQEPLRAGAGTQFTAKDSQHSIIQWIRNSSPTHTASSQDFCEIVIGEGPDYVDVPTFTTVVESFRRSEQGNFVQYELVTRFDAAEDGLADHVRVFRRYSDFARLQTSLSALFPLSQTFGLPPKRFSFDEDETFLETRRSLLERWLRSVSSHPALRSSEQVRAFLSTQDEKELASVLSHGDALSFESVKHPDFNIDADEATTVLRQFESVFEYGKATERHADAERELLRLRRHLADLHASSSRCRIALRAMQREDRVSDTSTSDVMNGTESESEKKLLDAHERVCDLSHALAIAQNLIAIAGLTLSEHARFDQHGDQEQEARYDTVLNVVCAEMNHLMRQYDAEVRTIERLTEEGLALYHQEISARSDF
ncbi:PX domain-containing protein [Microbotryomycetes sp. JL201]|nr:PX domain-containing protein [Microbotryomycetes sp. JL201]